MNMIRVRNTVTFLTLSIILIFLLSIQIIIFFYFFAPMVTK